MQRNLGLPQSPEINPLCNLLKSKYEYRHRTKKKVLRQKHVSALIVAVVIRPIAAGAKQRNKGIGHCFIPRMAS
jgi:hypothetical protein